MSKIGKPETREARFWRFVQKTEAYWLWIGSLSKKGYGQIDKIMAHRFSFELHTRASPGVLFVCHRCDNPRCVRPDHLFLGTNDDNVADKMTKGREVRGARVVTAKLNAEQVRRLRAEYIAGATQPVLAERYGLTRTHVSDIVCRKAWRHVA